MLKIEKTKSGDFLNIAAVDRIAWLGKFHPNFEFMFSGMKMKLLTLLFVMLGINGYCKANITNNISPNDDSTRQEISIDKFLNSFNSAPNDTLNAMRLFFESKDAVFYQDGDNYILALRDLHEYGTKGLEIMKDEHTLLQFYDVLLMFFGNEKELELKPEKDN